MPAAVAIPLADVTPYLLQQTALRASLLQTSFGFAADDWDDLRQDLALDCLRRLPRFDGSRGNWKGFVHGVVRNHACVLASRQIQRRQFQPLEFDTGSELPDGSLTGKADEEPAEDFRPFLELGLDTERVLAGLPEDLRGSPGISPRCPYRLCAERPDFTGPGESPYQANSRGVHGGRPRTGGLSGLPDDECPTDSDSVHRD